MSEVYSFACTMTWWEHESIIIARTRAKAKREYLLHVQDVGFYKAGDPDRKAKYVDVRCRKVGTIGGRPDLVTVDPAENAQFYRNARYRNLPEWVRIGTRVKVSGEAGVIVGHNADANLNVLFDEDTKYPGLTLNCHPHYQVEYIPDSPPGRLSATDQNQSRPDGDSRRR
jgi:hypothetical protein